jgi:RNA polymerase sigma factor (sigma-70 family)
MNTNQKTENKAEYDIASLVNQHHSYLKNFVLRLTKNRDITDDILQETYIQAIKSIDNFEGRSQIKTWLAGIAVNITRSYHKQIYRQKFDDSADISIIADSALTPEQNTEQNQSVEKILTAFQQMPENMAKTAYLVLCQNQSYEEAAQNMNVPIGTVRSRISRARAFLQNN